MVSKEEFEGEEAYRCAECGLHYRNRRTAERCENFCSEKNACHSEIIEKSIERS